MSKSLPIVGALALGVAAGVAGTQGTALVAANPASFAIDGACAFDADNLYITGPNPQPCHDRIQRDGLVPMVVPTPPRARFSIPGMCEWDGEGTVTGPNPQPCHARLQGPEVP